MSKYSFLIFLFLLSASVYAQKKFPVVNDFGGVYDVPEAEKLIDPNKNYKIVIDITEAEKKPTIEANKAYDLVARLINLYSSAGLVAENLDIIVVIHYEATPTILSDEAHQLAYKTNNPNTAVINKLAQHGVKFYVCGQSLRSRKLVEYKKNVNIKVAHGAILALTHFQNIGYSLLKMH
jgi:intracellular sulfur oxidation DsrE/DsrF family protein